jgi:hypothetical protein
LLENMAMVAEDPGDPVHGGRAVGMIGLPKSQEPSECLMVLIRDMHRSEMPAPVKLSQHDGVYTICLTVVARFSWDERRSNHLTREPVVGEKTLQNEPRARGFVATSDRSL